MDLRYVIISSISFFISRLYSSNPTISSVNTYFTFRVISRKFFLLIFNILLLLFFLLFFFKIFILFFYLFIFFIIIVIIYDLIRLFVGFYNYFLRNFNYRY